MLSDVIAIMYFNSLSILNCIRDKYILNKKIFDLYIDSGIFDVLLYRQRTISLYLYSPDGSDAPAILRIALYIADEIRTVRSRDHMCLSSVCRPDWVHQRYRQTDRQTYNNSAIAKTLSALLVCK